jgi:long-chain acyl-CoA synthetase
VLISGDRRLSHPELQQRAQRAAAGFRALGVGEDQTVALLLRNDFPYVEASLGAGLIGALATPINWHFTAVEAGYILADCGARALVVHADLWPTIAPAVPAGLPVFIVPPPPEIRAAYRISDAAAAVPAGMTSWDEFLAKHTSLELPQASPRSMIYTSGTTGRPKGVKRVRPTAEHMEKIRTYYAWVFGLKAGEEIVALMNGPFYHSSPNSYVLICARMGLKIVMQARFDPEEMLQLIDRHRITHMHIVPAMFVRLLRLPDEVKRKYDVSSLRFVIHGAAPCPPDVKRAMIQWWGPVIYEYYGSTETGIVCVHNSEEALTKPGTVGRVLEGSVLKVLDGDGKEVPTGEIGELYMRQSLLTDFTYHGDETKRREVGRGELVTVGDVGYVDADGYVYLCDRKRDMVISGGVNIYPAEIESALILMPGVKDCAVFGIPDEEFGEGLCAYVEPEAGVSLTPEAVRAFLGTRLAKYKIPKVVEFAADLPREDSGKIFKRKLREPYWAKAGRSI